MPLRSLQNSITLLSFPPNKCPSETALPFPPRQRRRIDTEPASEAIEEPHLFEALARLNAKIDVDIVELRRDTLFMKDIEFNMTVRDGVLNISKARFRGHSGEILAKARLDPANGTGAASLQLVARDFSLGVSETTGDLLPTGDLDINLNSTGTNMRALAGNANGIIFINTRGPTGSFGQSMGARSKGSPTPPTPSGRPIPIPITSASSCRYRSPMGR